MPSRAYTDAEIDAAIDALTHPRRLREAQDVVSRTAPSLQRLLGIALEEGGWFDLAQDQYLAGALSQLELLTTEQSLVAADSAVAASDAALSQDQIAVFKALGGGWRTAAR